MGCVGAKEGTTANPLDHLLKGWSERARYSLVVTIKTPGTEVDIYTPVMNLISPKVPIEIS
jgi:CRISPR/Cas system CMR-associated protein Cmr1 (group 7 of RAMP superfamily)